MTHRARPVSGKSAACARARFARARHAAVVALHALGALAAFAQDADPATAQARLAAVRAAEARRVEVLAQASRSVVCIFATAAKEGGGSGVLISPDGYGLTNFHVVADFLESRRGVGGLNDGRLYPLTVLGIDPGGDIVMFKLEGKSPFDFAPLGDSDQLRVGQRVAAIGNPFLVAEDLTPTITLGIISGLQRYQEGSGETGNLLEYADCIQVSTSINPGNSGGPLFDMSGRVIGINGRASFEERGRVNVGLGYAVTINQVRRFIPGLRAGRLCEHGTLGATVRLAGKVLIVSTIQDLSPAEKAGVELGDELLAINERAVRTPNDYNNAIAILPADWPVQLRIRREGQERTLVCRLERLPLRLPAPYLVDFEHNHREVARQFQRFQARHLDLPDGSVKLTWTGRISEEHAGETIAVDVAVSQTPAGDVTVRFGDRELHFRAADDPPPLQEAADASQPAASGSAFWREWSVLSAPLWRPVQPGYGWEMLAGDEIGGRIATIIERRLADRVALRWQFDLETDALLGMTSGTTEFADGASWKLEAWSDASPRWPTRWVRTASAGGVIRVEVHSLRALPFEPEAPSSTTQPQSATSTQPSGAATQPDVPASSAAEGVP